jgi:hypothetical protein
VLGVRARQEPPALEAEGIVSAATYEAYEPLAPGSLISLFGVRLSEGETTAGDLPLPNTLAGTSVLIGGKPAPLLFSYLVVMNIAEVRNDPTYIWIVQQISKNIF